MWYYSLYFSRRKKCPSWAFSGWQDCFLSERKSFLFPSTSFKSISHSHGVHMLKRSNVEKIFHLEVFHSNSDLILTPQNISGFQIISAAVEYRQKLMKFCSSTYPSLVHRLLSKSIRNRTQFCKLPGRQSGRVNPTLITSIQSPYLCF